VGEGIIAMINLRSQVVRMARGLLDKRRTAEGTGACEQTPSFNALPHKRQRPN
jgi:hypothetical protein